MAGYDKAKHLLERIDKYCDEIDSLTKRFGNTYEAYCADSAYRHASSMCTLHIGELASRLPDDFKTKYSGVSWKEIRGMRNIFAHDYDNVNMDEAWRTITVDIPHLKEYCGEIMRLEGYDVSEVDV